MRRVAVFIVSMFLLGPGRALGDGRADTLEGSGDGHLRYTEQRLWSRRLAIRELEEVALRDPDDLRVLVRLGQAYLDAGFVHLARVTFERILRTVPDDPDAHFGLGKVYERGWLALPTGSSPDTAAEHFERATRTRPAFWEAWTALAVLRFERRDLDGAREAALKALASAPDRVEPQIVNAYLAYRTGMIARSDSLFTVAIPRLPAGIAARFDDIAPLVTPEQADRLTAMEPRKRAEFVQQFWMGNDPDPTTPQNEARLEYYSRLSHAMMLLVDPWSPRWIARTDLYARYGHRVQIEDPFDSRHEEMPHVEWGDEAVAPTPRQLAALGQIETENGRAIFAPLPPGTHEIPFESFVARFEGSRGPRLLAQVEARGSPGDDITADCVVLDSLRQTVARDSRPLTASACDPAERHAGQFVFDLEPGRYELAFAVYDRKSGRGVGRASCRVEAGSPALSMSDIVLQCGPANLSTRQGTVRLDPNLAARIEGTQHLYAYFEIYHLHTTADGGNRFEYEYSIHDMEGRERTSERARRSAMEAASRLAFHSVQEGSGALRRQFIDVPAGTLPAGHYRLTILVIDALAGTRIERSAEFLKVEASPAE